MLRVEIQRTRYKVSILGDRSNVDTVPEMIAPYEVSEFLLEIEKAKKPEI